MNQIADIFNINKENTNSRDITQEMQILSYLSLKLLLMEDILSDFSENCGQN